MTYIDPSIKNAFVLDFNHSYSADSITPYMHGYLFNYNLERSEISKIKYHIKSESQDISGDAEISFEDNTYQALVTYPENGTYELTLQVEKNDGTKSFPFSKIEEINYDLGTPTLSITLDLVNNGKSLKWNILSNSTPGNYGEFTNFICNGENLTNGERFKQESNLIINEFNIKRGLWYITCFGETSLELKTNDQVFQIESINETPKAFISVEGSGELDVILKQSSQDLDGHIIRSFTEVTTPDGIVHSYELGDGDIPFTFWEYGEHLITYQVQDDEGKWSEKSQTSYTALDPKNPPIVSIVVTPPVGVDKKVLVTVNAKDNEGHLTSSFLHHQKPSGGWFTYDYGIGSYEFDLTESGTHYFYFEAIDNDGNWSERVSSTYTLQTNLPTPDFELVTTDIPIEFIYTPNYSDPDNVISFAELVIFRPDDSHYIINGAQTAKIVFDQAGDWRVKLSFFDENGVRSTEKEITISVEDFNYLPVILVNYDDVESKINEKISLSAEGSYDPDGDSLDFSWEVSDGQTFSGTSIDVQFTEAGEYFIDLIVKDTENGKSLKKIKVTVLEATKPIQIATYSWSKIDLDTIKVKLNNFDSDLDYITTVIAKHQDSKETIKFEESSLEFEVDLPIVGEWSLYLEYTDSAGLKSPLSNFKLYSGIRAEQYKIDYPEAILFTEGYVGNVRIDLTPYTDDYFELVLETKDIDSKKHGRHVLEIQNNVKLSTKSLISVNVLKNGEILDQYEIQVKKLEKKLIGTFPSGNLKQYKILNQDSIFFNMVIELNTPNSLEDPLNIYETYYEKTGYQLLLGEGNTEIDYSITGSDNLPRLITRSNVKSSIHGGVQDTIALIGLPSKNYRMCGNPGDLHILNEEDLGKFKELKLSELSSNLEEDKVSVFADLELTNDQKSLVNQLYLTYFEKHKDFFYSKTEHLNLVFAGGNIISDLMSVNPRVKNTILINVDNIALRKEEIFVSTLLHEIRHIDQHHHINCKLSRDNLGGISSLIMESDAEEFVAKSEYLNQKNVDNALSFKEAYYYSTLKLGEESSSSIFEGINYSTSYISDFELMGINLGLRSGFTNGHVSNISNYLYGPLLGDIFLGDKLFRVFDISANNAIYGLQDPILSSSLDFNQQISKNIYRMIYPEYDLYSSYYHFAKIYDYFGNEKQDSSRKLDKTQADKIVNLESSGAIKLLSIDPSELMDSQSNLNFTLEFNSLGNILAGQRVYIGLLDSKGEPINDIDIEGPNGMIQIAKGVVHAGSVNDRSKIVNYPHELFDGEKIKFKVPSSAFKLDEGNKMANIVFVLNQVDGYEENESVNFTLKMRDEDCYKSDGNKIGAEMKFNKSIGNIVQNGWLFSGGSFVNPIKNRLFVPYGYEGIDIDPEDDIEPPEYTKIKVLDLNEGRIIRTLTVDIPGASLMYGGMNAEADLVYLANIPDNGWNFLKLSSINGKILIRKKLDEIQSLRVTNDINTFINFESNEIFSIVNNFDFEGNPVSKSIIVINALNGEVTRSSLLPISEDLTSMRLNHEGELVGSYRDGSDRGIYNLNPNSLEFTKIKSGMNFLDLWKNSAIDNACHVLYEASGYYDQNEELDQYVLAFDSITGEYINRLNVINGSDILLDSFGNIVTVNSSFENGVSAAIYQKSKDTLSLD